MKKLKTIGQVVPKIWSENEKWTEGYTSSILRIENFEIRNILTCPWVYNRGRRKSSQRPKIRTAV